MTKKVKPKRCIFCGGKAIIETEYKSEKIADGMAVHCEKCPARIVICKIGTPGIRQEHVIKMWNDQN